MTRGRVRMILLERNNAHFKLFVMQKKMSLRAVFYTLVGLIERRYILISTSSWRLSISRPLAVRWKAKQTIVLLMAMCIWSQCATFCGFIFEPTSQIVCWECRQRSEITLDQIGSQIDSLQSWFDTKESIYPKHKCTKYFYQQKVKTESWDVTHQGN